MAANVKFTSLGEIETNGGWKSKDAPLLVSVNASGALVWSAGNASASGSYNAGLSLLGRANTWTAINTFSAGSEVGASSTSGAITVTSGGIVSASGIKGSKVYNAVWNDLADAVPVNTDCVLIPGRCYCYKEGEFHLSSKYLDEGIMGIHSDTYGMLMGGGKEPKELYVAVAGFVLAYVDKEYIPGTPLTCDEEGFLTEIRLEDKIKYPERIVATFWKTEPKMLWGPAGKEILVNGRMWVKVK